MSLKSAVLHSIDVANKAAGGSRSTRGIRRRHAREFIESCLQNNIPIAHVKGVTIEMLKSWVANLRRSRNNSEGTIANKLSSVRALVCAAGGKIEHDNEAVGVEQRSRIGKKLPISDAKFEEALAAAVQRGEIGFFHALRLERFLGLRGLEALMSTEALKKAVADAQDIIDRKIEIIDGTKGGRERKTAVILKYSELTLQVIREALEFAVKNGGYLIMGATPGLKSARSRYHRLARMVGLVGESAPHALRYRYTVDKLEELRDAGVPAHEALALLAGYIGHGEGRGRFVRMVYARTLSDTYPSEKPVQSLERLLDQIKRKPKPGQAPDNVQPSA